MMFPPHTSRSLAHRARVLNFLGQQILGPQPLTTAPQALGDPELALYIIDVMTVGGCERWNATIACQTASEALPRTSKLALAQIVDLIQWKTLAA